MVVIRFSGGILDNALSNAAFVPTGIRRSYDDGGVAKLFSAGFSCLIVDTEVSAHLAMTANSTAPSSVVVSYWSGSRSLRV